MCEQATDLPRGFGLRDGRPRRRPAAALIRAAAVIAALTLPAGAPAATKHHQAHIARGCPNAETYAPHASAAVLRTAVLCLVNYERTSRHLPALRAHSRLDRSAQGWTEVMVSSGNFGHGSDPGARVSAAGFRWSSVGENIATGYPTARAVVSAWMASTGHCQNILAPDYSYAGTGVSNRAISGFSSGPATWTQDFGLPAGARAPSGNWGPAKRCPY